MRVIEGRVWVYGDNVNTDVIFPGRYTYSVSDPSEMAKVVMEDLDPDFAKEVKEGDVVVAGKNFGCGSSREQAAFALKYAGVGACIADSFARIFFRNGINAGLPLIELPGFSKRVKKGSRVRIDLEEGIVEVLDTGEKFEFAKLTGKVAEIFKAGGLTEYIKENLRNRIGGA